MALTAKTAEATPQTLTATAENIFVAAQGQGATTIKLVTTDSVLVNVEGMHAADEWALCDATEIFRSGFRGITKVTVKAQSGSPTVRWHVISN